MPHRYFTGPSHVKHGSEVFVNLSERLERLRHARTVTWAELREVLGIGETMLHYLKTGQRQPSPKLIRRIEQAEREADLLPPAAIYEPRGSMDSLGKEGRAPTPREELMVIRDELRKLLDRVEQVVSTMEE